MLLILNWLYYFSVVLKSCLLIVYFLWVYLYISYSSCFVGTWRLS
nr:MAG TPA: hypothetical protein [Caudoviricetes sp.]